MKNKLIKEKVAEWSNLMVSKTRFWIWVKGGGYTTGSW